MSCQVYAQFGDAQQFIASTITVEGARKRASYDLWHRNPDTDPLPDAYIIDAKGLPSILLNVEQL